MPLRSSRRDLLSALIQLRRELRRRTSEIEDLRPENEILRKAAAPLIHHAPACERFAFVHTAHPAYGALRVTRELQRQGVPVDRRV